MKGQICNDQKQELLQDLLVLRDARLGNRNHHKVGREWWQQVSSVSTLALQRAANYPKMMGCISYLSYVLHVVVWLLALLLILL